MGYYISVGLHEPVTTPSQDASEAEWERCFEEIAQAPGYGERLGSIGYINTWVSQIAAQLELPLLSSLDWCLQTSPELDELEQELNVLEQEWRGRGLHLPGADVGWGRSYEDLLFPLNCFRDALAAARRTGFPLCAG